MPYIPDSVFEGGTWETLSAVEAKVYVTLCQHYNRKERMAFPSMLRIAKICGCSKRHVVRVVELLAQKGLIVKRKKDNPYGRSFNYYRLPVGIGEIILIFSLYFLPFLIAALRQHKNALGIFLLNFLLGWTGFA